MVGKTKKRVSFETHDEMVSYDPSETPMTCERRVKTPGVKGDTGVSHSRSNIEAPDEVDGTSLPNVGYYSGQGNMMNGGYNNVTSGGGNFDGFIYGANRDSFETPSDGIDFDSSLNFGNYDTLDRLLNDIPVHDVSFEAPDSRYNSGSTHAPNVDTLSQNVDTYSQKVDNYLDNYDDIMDIMRQVTLDPNGDERFPRIDPEKPSEADPELTADMESLSSEMTLAKAVYDNPAEAEDELSFKRGDILTVLEKNTQGLDGWWLCLLRGRQGIAPGNRLCEMKNYNDEGGGGGVPLLRNGVRGQTTEEEKNIKNFRRRSWLVNPNKVLTPKRKNDVYIYEHPNEVPDYDVPQPSHHATENGVVPDNKINTEIFDTPSYRGQESVPSAVTVHSRQGSIGSASDMKVAPQDMYDTLPSRTRPVKKPSIDTKPSVDTGEEDYDHPVSMNDRIRHFQDKYESPKTLLVNNEGCNSNRSSALSTLSNVSGHSGSSSASNRSFQADNSHTEDSTYDVPRKPVEIANKTPIRQDAVDVDSIASNSLKRNQMFNNSLNATLSKNSSVVSADDIYDTPPPNPQPVTDIYNVPPKPRQIEDKLSGTKIRDSKSSVAQSRTSGDSGIETGKIDIPPKVGNHNVSDQEGFYDHPRNNRSILLRPTKEKSSLYDIPPQVTRDDSIHSFKMSDRMSMDTCDTRSSLCSSSDTGSDIPIITYDELPLNLDAANDLFVKLQQNLQRDTNNLLSFVNSKWLNRASVEIHLLDIKQACFALKDSLKEFVEFGQGALANSAKTDDKKLVKKIHKHLEPLQNGANNVGECCENITKAGWLVSNLSNDNGTTANIENINMIVNEAKDVLENARPLIAYIRGNAKLLFRKQGYEDNVIIQGFSSNQCITSTPVKPPTLKPKMSDISLDGSIQERPLPTPPMAKRPLPSTPSNVSNSSVSIDRSNMSINASASSNNMYNQLKSEPMYDTPKGSMHSGLDEENDYDNADEICSYEDDDGDYANDSKEWTTMPERGSFRNGMPPRAKSADIFLEGDSDMDSKPDHTRFSYHETQHSDGLNFSVPAPSSTGDLSNSTSGLSSRFVEKLGKLHNSTIPLTKYHSVGSGVVQPRVPKVTASDKQMLSFYGTQLETQTTQLTQAIDAFMQTMEYQQPPKVFLIHSKMVILVAHKFVYIGDTLTRNLMSEEIRTKLTFYGNKLCDSLKNAVTATKKAALQHPDKFALQEMVDKMADISYTAKDLKSEIARAAQAQVIGS